jgi:hypothetical protein
VLIWYSIDGGLTWVQVLEIGTGIGIGSSTWGNYPWKVPDTPSTEAVIKVEQYGGAAYDVSGSFVIRARQPSDNHRSRCGTGFGLAFLLPLVYLGKRLLPKSRRQIPSA